MRKIKLLLASVLCIAGLGTAKAEVITAASQLSNTKVYTIKTTRGYMTLNTDQTMIVSSHKSDGGTVNDAAATDDESRQFGIMNIDGKYFIYSPKLNQFACFQNWNLVFYTDRGVALDITNDGNGNPDGSKLRFFAHGMGSTGYNKFCLNNNNGGNLVLNNYNGAEAGNTVSIEEVAGVTLDVDAAMAVWNGTPDFFDPHKVYTISNKRITKWTANEAGTGLTGTSTYTGASDAYQQFAFFKYDGKPYLYNLGTKKFVATDGTLTSNKGDAATISVWRTGDTTYPYCFFIEEKGLLFNAQGGGGFSINGWNSSHDDGNKHGLVEVSGVDVYDEILALFEIPSWDVTYNIYFNSEKIGEEVRKQDQGSEAGVSSAWNNDFVTFTYSAETITTGVTSVDVTVNWTGPTLYPNYESIVWKNLYVDRTYEDADGSKNYLANTGNPPAYYVKNPTDKQRASDAYQWGFVGNPYQLKVYNKLAGPTQTLHPDNTIGMADGDSYWSIKISFNDGFMIGKTGNVNSFINQSGGYNGTNMGYWSSTSDYGNVFKFDDVPEIPLTNVYYDITFNGKVAHTATVSGLEIGEDVPAMPTVTLPAYTTVTAPDVTGQTVTENMRIEVPATWDGPFELSANLESAHWYDMAIRGTWYVTSDNKDGDGALKTVNANALGLGEDAYHWAFVGDPWHIQVYNKAEANNFGYPTQANQGIPSFEADTYYWTIKASTSGIANSFVMNVGGTDLYINQYGGAGGSLKFWNSGNNISDKGSAFTVFDIPTDYATYVASEITPSMESTSKYFVLKPAVAATVGYDAVYKTSCTFEQYKAMKLAFMAIDMTDLNNFVMPETGYYLLKNKNYGTYMGIDPSDANMYGNYKTAVAAKQIVKLTKTGDATYTIGLMDKFAPATVAESAQVTATAEAGTYTVVVPAVGYAAFQADTENNMSVLHCAGGGSIVGWEAPAAASQWIVEDATSIELAIGTEGYATAYLPFPVTIPAPTVVAVPEALGTWTFDDPTDLTAGTGTATLEMWGTGVTAADGPDADNGAVSAPKGGGFTLDTHLSEVSSAYTLLMDVSFPDVSGFNSLYQNDINNGKDGSIFINGGKIGLNYAGLGYNGSISANTWYRIAIVVDNGYCTIYVDGEKVSASTSQDINAWAMRDTKKFLLFVDDSGEEKVTNTSEVRFWDVALNAEEVALLGGVGHTPESETRTVKAYTGKFNSTWLDLIEVNGTIPAATPVVLKGDPTTYVFEVANDVDPIEGNVLKGTFAPIEATGKYVLAQPEGEKVGFYLAESGNIAAGKAYLELDGTGPLVKAFYFSADDATGIENLNTQNTLNAPIYNLAGQRISKMQKGINIVNGKKILK